jgi:hypothetical protein
VSDRYLGATNAELPGGRSRARGPVRGARIMGQRLAAALILAALTVTCACGCHDIVKVNTHPAPHASTSGQ